MNVAQPWPAGHERPGDGLLFDVHVKQIAEDVYRVEAVGLKERSRLRLTIEEIAAKDVPAGKPYQIVDVADIPSDRTFRNAWEYTE